MTPLQRARLVDVKSYAMERARFYGVECLVMMRMGCEDRAVQYAHFAFRYAVEANAYYREEN